METFRTHCSRMDHGGCGLLVDIEAGQVRSIRGDPDSPISHGFLCPKGRFGADRLTHPARLKQPLLRKGDRGSGKWTTISWEAALDLAAERFIAIKQRYGAGSVIFCQGSPKGLEHFILIRLANLFGSPNVVGPQNICHMPREVSARHTLGFFPVVDYEGGPDCVIVWGSNLTSTNEEGVICSRLLRKLDGGTRLIVVDPRRTELARKADLWLQLRPGSDVFLALAFIQEIIKQQLYNSDFVEQWTHGFDMLTEHVAALSPDISETYTGIPADLVRTAARMYATAHPAAIQWGNGIEQTTANFDICRALLCLMSITGNIDCPGANIEAVPPPVMKLGEFVRTDMIPDKRKNMILTYGGIIPGMMINPPPLIKKAILTEDPYPVKAAYVHVSNPVVSWANPAETIKAMQKLDFLVVSELFKTPTAALADLILPVATHFEIDDIGHYGLPHGYILARPRLIAAPHDCRADSVILNELGKRISSPDLWWPDTRTMLDCILEPSGMNYEQFCRQGYLFGPKKYKKYETKGFKTRTGKIELALTGVSKKGFAALPAYDLKKKQPGPFPLLATSHKSRYLFCSANRETGPLRRKRPTPWAEIHPDDAVSFGIKNNEKMIIETEFGSIWQIARITSNVSRGVISLAQGWWFPEKEENLDAGLLGARESNINTLVSSHHINASFGTPNLRAFPCSVRSYK